MAVLALRRRWRDLLVFAAVTFWSLTGIVFALLATLETMGRGEVLRQGDTVWSPRLGLTVIGFYGDREDGTVGLLDDPNDPRIRHVILEAYEPVSDFPRPVPITFCSDDYAGCAGT